MTRREWWQSSPTPRCRTPTRSPSRWLICLSELILWKEVLAAKTFFIHCKLTMMVHHNVMRREHLNHLFFIVKKTFNSIVLIYCCFNLHLIQTSHHNNVTERRHLLCAQRPRRWLALGYRTPHRGAGSCL